MDRKIIFWINMLHNKFYIVLRLIWKRVWSLLLLLLYMINELQAGLNTQNNGHIRHIYYIYIPSSICIYMFIYLCICLYLCNRCTCIHTHIAQFICIYEDKFTYLKLYYRFNCYKMARAYPQKSINWLNSCCSNSSCG